MNIARHSTDFSRRSSGLLTAVAFAALVAPSAAHATIIPYDITVSVTAAPTAPGSFASNPWDFPGGVPAVFSGSFDADDSIVGAISNLQLSIGGLDLAATHPAVIINSFDPGSLLLAYAATDPSQLESGVIFGSVDGGVPADYAAAVQDGVSAPLDPFLGNTQNWVGTLSIAAAVPEPGSALLVGAALAGLGLFRRRRR